MSICLERLAFLLLVTIILPSQEPQPRLNPRRPVALIHNQLIHPLPYRRNRIPILEPGPFILVLVSREDQQALILLPISTVQHPEAEDVVLPLCLSYQSVQMLQYPVFVRGPRRQFVYDDILAGSGGVVAPVHEVDGPPAAIIVAHEEAHG